MLVYWYLLMPWHLLMQYAFLMHCHLITYWNLLMHWHLLIYWNFLLYWHLLTWFHLKLVIQRTCFQKCLKGTLPGTIWENIVWVKTVTLLNQAKAYSVCTSKSNLSSISREQTVTNLTVTNLTAYFFLTLNLLLKSH